MKKLSFILAAIVFFASCRNEKNKEYTGTEKVDTLTYNYDSVKVYSKHIVQKYDDTTKAIITYSVFKNEILNRYIERQALNCFSKEDKSAISYQDIAKSFINGYDSFISQSHDFVEPPWFLIIDLKVLYQKDNYISIKYTHSDFTGGNHPNSRYKYINYNVKTNHILTIDSLIDNNKKEQLVNIAENIFRRNEKLSPKESLVDKYFFNDGKFNLPENFYINKKGLVFFYNHYEIKAYAFGVTELIIPFADLKDIAKPNTILTSSN